MKALLSDRFQQGGQVEGTSPRSIDSCTAVLQLPGADGDEGLVGDVAEDEEQHLVRTPPDVALIVTRRHLKHRGLLCHYGLRT